MLQLYSIFHLNLAYSSLEEEQRPDVIRRCYRPLLKLAWDYNLPFGIEATGYTLETISQIDPDWISELRQLLTGGPCEFIGSGYAQIIGPLVPAEVNAANLRIGNEVYERLLGFRPRVALINEQAYSAGLIQHYLDAGYQAIVMEWDNPYRYHPEWNPEWRYLPQIACGHHGEEILLIWNHSIAFQKFQRFAHADIELDEYMVYLGRHFSDAPRVFSLYGNDVEVFDFRPNRYETEAVLQYGEWERIETLLKTLLADSRYQFIRPRDVLDLMQAPGAGNRVHLESPEQPIPVKKQGKYNITRWAVTGRDDLGVNTACWRICEALKAASADDDNWCELCYLWSSDFRTHITEKRWKLYIQRLANFERKCFNEPAETEENSASDSGITGKRQEHKDARVEREGRYLTIETDLLKVRLNAFRGLAIDALWFKNVSDKPLCGTLPHGYYDDIQMGADFYTGHLIMEAPGRPKLTDLSRVDPLVETDRETMRVKCSIMTALGPIKKQIRLHMARCALEIKYYLEWDKMPTSSLRLGHITVNPETFDMESLYCSTHNGGVNPETFHFQGTDIDHGGAVSSLISAKQGLGMTEGYITIGDATKRFKIITPKNSAALIGFISFKSLRQNYFLRSTLSAFEIDETRHSSDAIKFIRKFSVTLADCD